MSGLFIPGTRVMLEDPEHGPWYGRVVVCLCKRHKWQQQVGEGGAGRECGHARGFRVDAEACPWPMHVRWDGDGDNESHQGMDGLTAV